MTTRPTPSNEPGLPAGSLSDLADLVRDPRKLIEGMEQKKVIDPIVEGLAEVEQECAGQSPEVVREALLARGLTRMAEDDSLVEAIVSGLPVSVNVSYTVVGLDSEEDAPVE
jgi:hypothetical protein